ncbi:MAG: tyrosine-type recombinase/integrase [bacterium]|nr:tyrosine-type recombinase/integrase [bacterium]
MITPKRQISFLERKEVEQIVAKIKPRGSRNLRDKALIEVLFSTGLRIAECLALTLDEMIPVLDEQGTSDFPIIGKGGYQRVIYFSPKAKEAIRAYLALRKSPDERLFPLTPRGAQKMVKERARRAGIEKRVSPHVFRHSLATDLLRRGVDIAFVSKFLGHRNINNTLIYTHIVSPQLKQIHEKLYK